MTSPPNLYDDILHLPRPTSARMPMPREKRAAQFMPFAALTGFEDCIDETGRLTCAFSAPDEAAQAELDRQLQALREHPKQVITVCYFQPDPLKDGGAYMTLTGMCKRADDIAGELVMQEHSPIPFRYILSITMAEGGG